MNFVLFENNSARKLVFVFVFLAILMTLGSFVLFSTQKKRITTEKQNELTSICKLKVQQIVNWRNERLGNAESIFHNKSFINDVKDLSIGKNRAENFTTISSWINYLKKIYHYQSIILLDKNKNVLIETENAGQIGPNGAVKIKMVLENKEPIMTDLHKSSKGVIHLDLIIPLYTDIVNKKDFCGILFFRLDPNQFLYPLIQSWPTPSKSSETVLVCREGDSVLFLNELRDKKNTALNFYRPLSDTTSPSVKAVLGITGNFEGINFRGINVLANLQKIPDSPWFIIAMVDKNEVFASLHRQAIWIFIFTTGLILLTGIIVFILWRLQISNSEKEKLLFVKHFDYLVKYTNDIILLSDLKGDIIECNDKAIAVYGYTREELLKLNVKQFRTKDSVNSFEQDLDDVLNKSEYVYETFHSKKNGESFPVEISGRIIEVAGEQYIQAVIRDITERKAIEEALRESEEIYKRLINTIPDIIFRCDLKGNILFINDSKDQTHGFGDKKDLLGKNISSFVAPEDIEKASNNIKLMFQHYLGPIEYKLILKNGNKADFEVTGDVLLDKEGNPNGMVFILRDITEQKNFEESLRTAKEMAEESDRLKSAFLANMSHEIRTPMNGILGFSELLDDDSLSPDDRSKFINVISENSRHLLGVVNDIIDISKIDSTQLAINNVSFNLNRLMDDVFMTYQNEKILKNKDQVKLEMNKSLSDEDSIIISDDIRLRQILYNLLGNALKFTKTGFIKFGYIVVDDKLQFMVQDTGKGIAKAKQSIVFERFRQEEDSYTRYFGGSGLGLSISKGLAELLGGKIWLESEVGVGSTFFFTIKY